MGIIVFAEALFMKERSFFPGFVLQSLILHPFIYQVSQKPDNKQLKRCHK